jgi:hypothetical protein
MRVLFPAIIFITFASACGDGSDSDDGGASQSGAGGTTSAGTGGGGTSGSAGTSPSAGGSSGAGAAGRGGSSGSGGSSGNGGGGKNAVRGAVSLDLRAPSGCSIAAGSRDFPVITGGHPVTATAKTAAVEDGGTTPDGKAADVSCRFFSASASTGFDASIAIGVGPSEVLVNLSASALTAGATTTGGIILDDPALPNQLGAPVRTCMHTPIEVDDATGSVWGSFTCPVFQTNDESDVCELGTSYYFFENCTKP